MLLKQLLVSNIILVKSHTIIDWVLKMIETSHSNNLFTFKRMYATHKPTPESTHAYRQEKDVPNFAFYNYQQIKRENHNWCSLYR